MMAERTPRDLLREEYFDLLPEIRRVANRVEVEVRHCLLPLTASLARHEHLVVKSRIKDCESALGKLLRKERVEGRSFDPERADPYTLKVLNDLVGVRVYAFPNSRWIEANGRLRQHPLFSTWKSDHRIDVAFKYQGYYQETDKVSAEVQLVPMLIGLFEDIEHDAVYKPSPGFEGAGPLTEDHRARVLAAPKAYDEKFESLLRDPLG